MGAVDTLHTSTNTLFVYWLAWAQVSLPSMLTFQQKLLFDNYTTSRRKYGSS
jgi:hypothetical protein